MAGKYVCVHDTLVLRYFSFIYFSLPFVFLETWLLCEVRVLWLVRYPECIRSQCGVLQIESIQKEYEQEMEQAQEEFEVSMSMACTMYACFYTEYTYTHVCTYVYVLYLDCMEIL